MSVDGDMFGCCVAVWPFVVNNAGMSSPGKKISLPKRGGDMCLPLERSMVCVKSVIVGLMYSGPDFG